MYTLRCEGLPGSCDFLLQLLIHVFLIPNVVSLKEGTLFFLPRSCQHVEHRLVSKV